MDKSCTDEEFIQLFEQKGAAELARYLGVTVRNIYSRRVHLENKLDRQIVSPSNQSSRYENLYPARLPIEIDNGVMIIGSDGHIWPGEMTTAQRAFLLLSKELKVKLMVLNGDVIDGARISRHSPIGWNRKPTFKEELEAVDSVIDQFRLAAPRARRIWTIGNHDARLENRLSEKAPEFEGVQGFCLKDHFPHWEHCISAWINNSAVLKHRFKGGIHAAHNNTLYAGRTIFTGHLHSLKVTPFDDYNGTRFGVDTGTIGDVYGPHTDYVEDNPLNHRSGFIIATFKNGRLLWPEVCRVVDSQHVDFRGELIRV